MAQIRVYNVRDKRNGSVKFHQVTECTYWVVTWFNEDDEPWNDTPYMAFTNEEDAIFFEKYLDSIGYLVELLDDFFFIKI